MSTRVVRLPFGGGRIILDRNPNGSAYTPAAAVFGTNLKAEHRSRRGQVLDTRDLGSGLVTHMGVHLLAQDSQALVSGTVSQALAALKYHGTGTGTTAAAASDYKLETAIGSTATADSTHTRGDSTPNATFVTVGTVAYTGGSAVTEWGLFNGTTLSATTGTPFTAGSGATWTSTGTALSANAFQGYVLCPGSTTVHALIYTNTTSAFTLDSATPWFANSNAAAGSTPGTTEAYAVRPCMFDHKVFSAINVINGDTITFTYTLTLTSGG